jgi:hypothetical protein
MAPDMTTAASTIRVCFHDKCFDGACSAALFTRLYNECINPGARVLYRGMVHRAGQLFDESMFDGDENAIVDFKYSSSPRLTWWFDHHQSAFLTEADAAHFRQDRSGRKFYFPEYRSCTKLISEIGARQFGFNPPEIQDLVYWADLIDGAQYPDARTAVEMKDPATQITLVIEGSREPDFVPSLVPELASKPLSQIAALPGIRDAFQRLYAQHMKWIELIGQRARLEGGVLFFDVSDQNFEGFNKFIPYYLFPGSIYSVAISQSPERIKLAVGSSPWHPAPKTANLASICERYGGGGHAKVAAISLPPGDLEGARATALSIVNELRGIVRQSG